MTSRSLLQCLLNTPWKYILLMPLFYLSGESPPSAFPLQFGQLFIFIFVIHFTKSKLIARSVPVFKLPETTYYPSSRTSTKKSSICRKYRHKSICINNTQLTTFYCYSTTNSITNFSNKQLQFTKFKRGITPQFILFPFYHYLCKESLIPAVSMMSRE